MAFICQRDGHRSALRENIHHMPDLRLFCDLTERGQWDLALALMAEHGGAIAVYLLDCASAATSVGNSEALSAIESICDKVDVLNGDENVANSLGTPHGLQ